MPTIFQFIFYIMIILFGLYWILRPQITALKSSYFYRNYSLSDYASEYRITSRQIFISLCGVVLIFLGTYGVVCKII